MSNAQKHILQCCWLAEKKNIVPKFSSSNSVSTHSYFQKIPRPTKVSSLDNNVIVIDDRQFVPTQANDTDFSITSKYFDNKSQISGDNQLDEQPPVSSKRSASNIKQSPPTANDDIATRLLPEEDFSFDNTDDPPLDPEGGRHLLYDNMSTNSPCHHPDPSKVNIVNNDAGEFNTEIIKKKTQNPKNLLQLAAGMTDHSGVGGL